MTTEPTEKTTWPRRLTLAVITGLVCGVTRALATWALNHLITN